MKLQSCYVMDIGTNSTRLMLACREEEGVRALYKLVRTVRTGEGASPAGLTAAAMERVCGAVSFSALTRKKRTPAFPYIFATSAVRDAANRGELTGRIKQLTGYEVDIISGEEEARLAFIGAAGLKGSGGVLDLGGGSTEFVRGENGVINYRQSFRTGIVRAKDMFLNGTASEKEAVAAAKSYSSQLFSAIPSQVRGGTWRAVGGTATCAASMLLGLESYSARRVQGFELKRAALQELLEKMLPLDVEARRRLAGIDPPRADVMCLGVGILLAAMDTLSVESLLVSDADNLEGYALAHLPGFEAP